MSNARKNTMNRREALKRVGYLLGGAVSAPLAFGFLNTGLRAEPGIKWVPEFFSASQAKTVSIVSDIIMPATDTPSASELGVPKFIEGMVGEVWSPTDRERFVNELETFLRKAKADLGKDFNDASSSEQKAFVHKRHEQIFGGNVDWSQRPFIWSMKELTITGYCTTEVGATKLLQYEAIPGGYEGCISLEEAGGRTWAT